ncbi:MULTISPECIES: hypothetical protein [Mesorhizobium]|uniref:hypothetical protein n=1 Tax=Mesorhizobium TaxID=68287 RepID=UPI0003CF2C22|nr:MULTISPECIES: hypothetical protein [Mesorhizobium]ESY71149.1 hypothetical protein X742_01515 [Mesorhizobium sp. LNHC232B00]WJI40939.1 hypothetical protein NL534_12120 [Mesorhizobium opportunistum]
MESAVAAQIACELSREVNVVYNESKKHPEGRQNYDFFFGWLAQLQLTFYVDEQTTINPTASFISKLHPLAAGDTFTLGLNASHKNEATRIDKVTLNYKIKDFIGDKPRDGNCGIGRREKGTVFIQNDLKIGEWLEAALNVAVSEGPESDMKAHPTFPKTTAISHDMKFDIVWSGGVAPSWKLVEFSAGSNPLFASSRDRYQQMVLTLGPPDDKNPNLLGPAAQVSSLASQINSSIHDLGRITP